MYEFKDIFCFPSFLPQKMLPGRRRHRPAGVVHGAGPGRGRARPKRLGPNDRPAIALIGCGGQGRGDGTNARRFGDIVAVCDVDDSHAAAAAEQFTASGRTPTNYNDFRKVMERDDINIIVNGHAGPLAYAGQPGGGQGGQGCLWGKAADPDH